MVDAQLERMFPNLAQSGYRVTSPATRYYNCIAWAADDTEDWWWPAPNAYWPVAAPYEESLDAFVQAFRTLGYELCDNGDLEAECEKIALYADTSGKPKHAARQLVSGKWTSKVGRGVDIEHNTLEALSGDLYGDVVLFLKREAR